MKKLYNFFLVLAIPALFLTLTSEIMYPSGSPGGKTGSPGDNGDNCTDCHSGTPINQEFWIYSPELLIQGYSPSQVYSFLVLGLDDNANKFGFEATAEDANGNKVGTFQAGALGMTQTINNSKAITHTALGNVPLVDSGTVWMFSWTAPPETVGNITFYAAINAANGNGSTSGDLINLTQFPVSPATSVFERKDNNTLGVYPNPSTGVIHLPATDDRIDRIEVLNMSGQLVFSQQQEGQTTRVDLSALDKGIYIVRIGKESQQIIIK